MKKTLSKPKIYLLICLILAGCGTSKINNKKQETPTADNKQTVSTTNQTTNTNKSIDEALERTKENNNEIIVLKSKIKFLEKELEKKGETTSVFNNPYSIYNQQVIMDNGTTYYGSVIYQDDQVVTIETLIGTLNLERARIQRVLSHKTNQDIPAFPEVDFEENINLIEDGNVLYKSPAEIILLGNISATSDDQGNAVISGRVKNTGGRRADFVKINITLYRDWSETLAPKTFTVFVEGTSYELDTDKLKKSQASVEPKAIAPFSLVVPKSFGTIMSWKYDIDYEEY